MTTSSDNVILRPSIIGSWFLFLGLAMGPLIIIFDRDPQNRNALWILMTVFFGILILHRLSVTYKFKDNSLIVTSWWGIFSPVTIAFKDIMRIEIKVTFASRVGGCGHLLVATYEDNAYLTILSQKNAEKLKTTLERLAKAAKAENYEDDEGNYDNDDEDEDDFADKKNAEEKSLLMEDSKKEDTKEP
jgi:uncharacterized membrane protein YdbT with pleckstrin-like domain